ncbi:MAG: prephenate dehydrogenase/arogenate dehydrogenase family protein [Hydrogenophilales bacterium CG03_land_8_20_14_0_80_62_28]|nr:prephenate dehydrogenase/arogenate dehydrogenase family protein [Betaproteobacteria bacterium]PIV23046.1 MAG: prephenate dehydrogenase/arogenate dehydrogenase family protein [Hydrogenophilales bacterium CG03_land_8_20_14_0_80_62_28]PIW71764.1 MAG: prephenate dehydrogenase/arogenate dehydrogenase family protein [Hydrogenophilales bacterium CG12_big_fil_rev_8_21_14_0_65_61_21]PIX02359.1 MAG: prephenate dehydrogenase/arogenate dehydrogenase family protein [Hydrogenophilales bacterium CG_4_8_14_3
MIRRLAVLGVGLIGGSVALALKQAGAVRQVIGYGRDRANLDAARSLGIVDEIADSPEQAVAGADGVLLAMPVGAMAETFVRIAPHLAADALLTDAGSTKQDVIAAARRGLGEQVGRFVPGHPIAGAEKSGALAARADLYAGRNVILTPLPENAAATVAAVADLWRACGARLMEMTAAEHDRVFAAVSHLPHLAAFALVDELASRPQAGLYFRLAGSGFRDFTRIAASSPEMWRDIALANREALAAELDAYVSRLSRLRDALMAGDGQTLFDTFIRASKARGNWAPAGTHLENDE